MLVRLLLLLLLLQNFNTLYAQETAGRVLHISRAQGAIKLDGIIDEADWQRAEASGNFIRTFPVDTGLATDATEIRMTFNDRFLYVSAKCMQPRKNYTVQSLKRDYGPGTSDVLNVLLGPFKDGLNGFAFGVNPLNVQREALIDNGANLAFEWDNKWYSAVHNTEEYWSVEIAIPFKTLRYKVAPGQNSWHVNFTRARVKDWEVSCWQRVPRQFSTNNLAFVGTLIWNDPPPTTGPNIALIPYATARYAIDYRRDPNTLEITSKPDQWGGNIGGDAKIGITPSLNLDLTINPDFSQVEVDRQVANLSRFELFFPERRQFFLENRDLFAMFGFPSTRPFFSRRIGLARNPLTGLNETVPILAGARLCGKLNDNWRIGALNMQTRQVDWRDTSAVLPGANFGVLTLQRKVFGRSAISGIFVNKTNALKDLTPAQHGGMQPWHRVAGLEYNLYSKDNRWEGEWYYHRSFSPDPQQRGSTLASFLGYNDRHFSARAGYLLIDSFYTAEAGFVPRAGTQNFFPGIGYRFFPEKGFINSWSINADGEFVYDMDFKLLDRDLYLGANATFKDQSGANVGLYNAYTFLFDAFDPTNLYEPGTQPLPADTAFSYYGLRGEYFSSTTFDLQGFIEFNAGQYFNGRIFSLNGNLVYRIQPFGTVGLSYSYNRIRLPEPYASADLWLLGPSAELSLNRRLFVSGFFQYNTQANNFNINARLQWRFAPVSDIFLVYTDNTFAKPIERTPIHAFSPKNKTIVLKMVYWLNV